MAAIVVAVETDLAATTRGNSFPSNSCVSQLALDRISLAARDSSNELRLRLGKTSATGHNPSMFSSSKLTSEQKEALVRWAAEGATMSDLQSRLKDEFDLTVTYMDTRFIALDLKLELHEEPKAPEKKPEALPVPKLPTGSVSVSIDSLTHPGALISGQVTFSDGETGVWMLDQTGRPGLDPDTAGYQPTAADIQEFQTQLRALVQKSGL